MPCHSLETTREWTAERLASELPGGMERTLNEHLESCDECRQEADALARTWDDLGLDAGADPKPSPVWTARTRGMLEEKTLERRIVPFLRRRPVLFGLAQAAGLVLAACAGYLAARKGPVEVIPFQPAAAVQTFPVASEKTLDVSKAVPDLSSRPRMTNVSFQPADAQGKVAISFEVTSRYTVIGRPEDQGVASVVSYLLSGSTLTDGMRGKAIEMVSGKAAQDSTLSPEVLSTLTSTLRNDRNPSVRRKAAEALAKLPPSREVRDALLLALKNDPNPAIRMTAIEGLARAGTELKDPSTIEILREKASDGKENGYVRVKAASLLAGAQL